MIRRLSVPSTARTFAARACAAVCTILLAVALLPAITAHAAEEVRPVIRPQRAGNTAVQGEHRIDVDGTAPAGDIQAARLLALGADGNVLGFQVIPGGDLNKPGVSGVTNDFLRNDGGKLTGQLTLGCKFAKPSGDGGSCDVPGVRAVALQVTVNGQTGRSNALRVDYTLPVLQAYEVVQTNRIRAIFSEPVRHRQGDAPSDWTVEDPARTVVAVENPPQEDCREPREYPEAQHECTRVLVLDQPLPEDAEPTVNYTNSETAPGVPAPGRTQYEDFADNRTLFVDVARLVALDLVRPAKPQLESVDGKAPSAGETYSNNPKPNVRLANVTAGHTARVLVTAPNGVVRTYAKVVEPNSNATDVTLDLPGDGKYGLQALAIDINGNRSDEENKNPPRADGARQSAAYILDTVAPKILTAVLRNRRTVDVRFTEPIYPPGNAGQWYVGDDRVTAEGAEDERRLVAQVDLDDPGPVRWEPTSEQPNTTGRYGDRAGNGMQPFGGIILSDLPAIPAPTVTVPPSELYTSATRTTIAGTAPTQANLAVDLYERGVAQRRDTTDVQDGRWSFDEPLEADRRYEFEVALRDTQTGVTSTRVPVPDIVRDTAQPVVAVTQPAQAPLSPGNATDRRPRHGVGDPVTIRWSATDDAPGDPERPDHGDVVDIIAVYDDDTRRTVASGIGHQPKQEQTYTYTLTEADLAGAANRELRFEVGVTDLARNRGADTSDPILLLAGLIGYTPVLVQPTVIEARFPVLLTGETAPGEWYVDEVPAQMASKTTRDGVTVIRLTVAQNDDPNATPTVRYQPLPVNPAPLRAPNGAEISKAQRLTVDGIAPRLSVVVPDTGNRPLDADTVPFSGTTDETSRPNTISAFHVTEGGAVQASPVATTTAGTDGEWRMDVPLTPNALNRIVVRAADPSGNVSARLPDPPYTVVEDSLAPVVSLTQPNHGDEVDDVVQIRWETTEANKESVRIEYRTGTQEWETITDRTADDGSHDWTLPEQVKGDVFSVRVTATDQTGKSGAATADGLRLDVVDRAAITITKARAVGAQIVEVTFSEPATIAGTSGFTVGGAAVRRVRGDGLTRSLLLDDAVDSATPEVVYSGGSVKDAGGNDMEGVSVTAKRAFAFAVRGLNAERLTATAARVSWSDGRNRPSDLRGYRVYRNGSPIALVGSATYTFRDRAARGTPVYSVRAVDDRARVSSVRRVSIR